MASKGPFITTLPVPPLQARQADSDPAPIDRLPAGPGHPVYASAPLFSDHFPSAIRLLLLHKQDDSASQLRVSLFSTDLDPRRVPYYALSYAWTRDTSATIILNGHPFKISSDLYQCLQSLSKQDLVLWVDAICINQADDVERAAQVAIMSQIYRNCLECLVWLGPEENDSHLVFDLVAEFEDLVRASAGRVEDIDHEKLKQMCSLDAARNAFIAFCTRPYWSRLWIVQENMLASRVGLRAGNRATSGVSFRSLLLNMGLLTEEGFFTVSWKLAHNTMQLFEVSLAHRAGSVLDLLQSLLISQSCKFNDGRDVLYAILGLVDPRQTQELDFKVDYSMSTNRLWGAMTARIVRKSRSLNILTLCQPVAKPEYKEAAFRAKTRLIQHFLDNSMNDFDTALAVWRRNIGETEPDSMVVRRLDQGALEKVKEATQQLQSRRHLMSDFEFKCALAQAWLPLSACESDRLPTWVPNWSDTRKINSHILYGMENGQIAKRNFRASKDTKPNTKDLGDLDPELPPGTTSLSNPGSFTTLSFNCHSIDTIAQTFGDTGNEACHAVLQYWLVHSDPHHLIARMTLFKRVTAFVDMLLLRDRNDTPRMYSHDDMVDRWVIPSRDACVALINERADGDEAVQVADSSAGPSGFTTNVPDSERPITLLSSSERPAAVAAALKLLALETAEPYMPKSALDTMGLDRRAQVQSILEIGLRVNELADHFKIFITSSGFIGLAGRSVEQGDVVCIPLGCDVPLIIRPAPDTPGPVQQIGRDAQFHGSHGDEIATSQGISALLGPEYQVVDRYNTTSENYWLISESYVVGIMDGEYLDHLDNGVEPDVVTIY